MFEFEDLYIFRLDLLIIFKNMFVQKFDLKCKSLCSKSRSMFEYIYSFPQTLLGVLQVSRSCTLVWWTLSSSLKSCRENLVHLWPRYLLDLFQTFPKSVGISLSRFQVLNLSLDLLQGSIVLNLGLGLCFQLICGLRLLVASGLHQPSSGPLKRGGI